MIKDNNKVVVDFFADWCGPCKIAAPIFEQMQKENPDMKFYKVNVDEADDIAETYQVASLPTFLTFYYGKQKDKLVGFK